MSHNINSGRSANKRAIIDISDDEAREQPQAKKEAEPTPSQEVAELQQKLDKAEKDKQGAIRIAGEAQARVEFLENLIDKKPAVDGEKNNQVDELQKKIAELSHDRDDLAHKLTEADARENEQQQTIDEMAPKAAYYDRQEELRLKVQQQFEEEERAQRVQNPLAIDCDANIFALCLAGTPGTISLDSAISQLSEEDLRTDGKRGFKGARKLAFKGEKLRCDVCKRTVFAESILMHLYCDRHVDNVRAAGGAVSLVAFNFWMKKLERITKTTSSAVAVAPSAAAPDADDDDDDAAPDNNVALDSDAEDAPDAGDVVDDDDDEINKEVDDEEGHEDREEIEE